MLQSCYPLYLANRAVQDNQDLPVTDKYRGVVATRVALADEATLDAAIDAAVRAAPAMAALPAFRRKSVLRQAAQSFDARRMELAAALCVEAGKPIRDARGEVARLIDTFELAADECSRAGGEVLTLDASARARGYRGMTRRVPVGPVALIAPFNFPLNLAAHKIAPAIAAGCPFVLKPASRTPVGALLIGEVLAETDLPEGAFSILPCGRAAADRLVTDPRLRLLSFTGSAAVGWDLKARAGNKKVVLELGGNAACIVTDSADLDLAVPRLLVGAYYQSGQSCISVQRIYVHVSRYAELRERLLAGVRALRHGDPRDEQTFVGPLIDEAEARRLESWIVQAEQAGATRLCGGTRNGAMLQAALLENLPPDCALSVEEAFGPVALLAPYEDFDAVLAEVNRSRYGLQAGVFTRDLRQAMRAWDALEVGAVVVGDVPSWRVDHMPYGGVKDSGLGREGLRYAIEEMSEIRLLVIRDAD